jgi:hypothetical protein
MRRTLSPKLGLSVKRLTDGKPPTTNLGEVQTIRAGASDPKEPVDLQNATITNNSPVEQRRLQGVSQYQPLILVNVCYGDNTDDIPRCVTLLWKHCRKPSRQGASIAAWGLEESRVDEGAMEPQRRWVAKPRIISRPGSDNRRFSSRSRECSLHTVLGQHTHTHTHTHDHAEKVPCRT